MDQLDALIGHLTPGDNVIWHDETGSQLRPFLLQFVESSVSLRVPILYVTFDIGPRDLLSQLGSMGAGSLLTILDCFTWGAGAGLESHLQFYYEDKSTYPGRIVRVDQPSYSGLVSETFWGAFESMHGQTRVVFDSLTGMQRLWKSDEALIEFYKDTCPKLYELDTVAYWIAKGDSPSQKIRSKLNDIAQIAIDLHVKRGKEFLIPVKTGKRGEHNLGMKQMYTLDDNDRLIFTQSIRQLGDIDIPRRIKEARVMRGLSQKELAKQIGVSASSISQAESGAILPSLHTLFKLARALSVEMGYFLHSKGPDAAAVVLLPDQSNEIDLPLLPPDQATVRNVTPLNDRYNAHILCLEIPPGACLNSHFISYKGEEIGVLLSGSLEFSIDGKEEHLSEGEVVYLTTAVPDNWQNKANVMAKLLWICL